MKKISFYILILMIALASFPSFAQTEGTLHFMNSLPQVVYNNPAIRPKHKFSIGLPGSSIMTYYSNNGFSYKNLVTQSDSGAYVDMGKFSEKIAERNFITNAVQVDLFRLSFKTGKRFYWTYSLSSKTYNRLMIPKEMFSIVETSAFINNKIGLSPQLETLSYVESSWGASYKIADNLSVGFNAKLLKGIFNITTQESDITVSLDADYNLTTTANLDVKSSGIYSASQGNIDPNSFLKNTGFAFDAGVSYRFLDRLTLGASLIDIGGIKWKNDLYGFTLNSDVSSFSFTGINLDSLVAGNVGYISNEIDTLKSNFTPNRAAIEAYTSTLPAKAYLSADLELNSDFSVGGVLYFERMNDRIMPGITLGLNKHFGKHFSTALSYSIANRSYNNLGAGFSLNFTPIQFYMVGDNILGAPLSLAVKQELNPYLNTLKYFNIRAGLNIVFGWTEEFENRVSKNRRGK